MTIKVLVSPVTVVVNALKLALLTKVGFFFLVVSLPLGGIVSIAAPLEVGSLVIEETVMMATPLAVYLVILFSVSIWYTYAILKQEYDDIKEAELQAERAKNTPTLQERRRMKDDAWNSIGGSWN